MNEKERNGVRATTNSVEVIAARRGASATRKEQRGEKKSQLTGG